MLTHFPNSATDTHNDTTTKPTDPIIKLEKLQSALVLFNETNTESKEIAEYYIKKRNLNSNFLCGVYAPNSLYGNPDDLLSIRRQVINHCLCPQIQTATPCNENNIEELLESTKTPTHLVITKGMPTHLRNHPWNNASSGVYDKHHSVSFDYYLAHALLNEKANCLDADCLFGTNSSGLTSLPWLNAYTPLYRKNFSNNSTLIHYYNSTDSGRVPELILSQHKALAYGRIEGITLESTKNMIDRTLFAERNGLHGNVYGGLYTGNSRSRDLSYYLSESTGSTNSDCINSILGATFPVTGNDSCRVGWNQSDIPVSSTGNVRSVVNASAFWGDDLLLTAPWQLVQTGFLADMNRFLSWRKTSSTCTPICENLVGTEEIEACKNRSTDPFHELNTECVGVSEGFYGRQRRSFPVQFMGMYPPNWKTVDSGPHTATPPQLHPSKYIYFGDLDYRKRIDCSDKNGKIKSCDPRTEIYMYRDFPIAPSIPLDSQANEFHFAFKYKAYSLPISSVEVIFLLSLSNGNTFSTKSTLYLDESVTEWKNVETSITLSNTTPTQIVNLRVLIQSPTSDGSSPAYSYSRVPFYGHFAIDDIETIETKTNRKLINDKASRFEEPYLNNFVPGDWAGQVHRLGASAWWGSMSHFYTGGFAWDNGADTARAFLSGRTIGEALLYTGNGMSGIFYGDPLYQPFEANLYMDPALFNQGQILAGKNIWNKIYDSTKALPPPQNTIIITQDSPQALLNAPLYFNASYGKSEGARYSLDFCVNKFLSFDCENHWETISAGKEKQGVVPGTENGIMNLFRQTGYHIVRLKVYRDNHPESAIYQYARFFLVGSIISPELFLKRARFTGSGWNIALFDELLAEGNFLDGISRNWRGNINTLELICYEEMGFCNSDNLNIQLTSNKGNTIPPHTQTYLYEYDYESQSFIKRFFFSFQSYLPACDSLRLQLVSGNHSVTFNDIKFAVGDFNLNYLVDAVDFIIFRSTYNTYVGSNGLGDLNGNMIVDASDFALFRAGYNCNPNP